MRTVFHRAFLYALPILLLSSCDKYPNLDILKEDIISYSEEKALFYDNNHFDVINISIDSVVINDKTEPMEGLLYTTWEINVTAGYIEVLHEYVRETKREIKPVEIKIYNIHRDGIIKKNWCWTMDWIQAQQDAGLGDVITGMSVSKL